MVQIFHPSTNTLSKVSIFGAVFFAGALAWTADSIHRSAWVTGANVAIEQPVPFSHKHHVQGLGLDCRYCHTSVEDTAFAGIPPTKTCMTCHSQVWTESEMLAPVRESYANNESIEWVRVHDLPDFVYFNHSIHVARGVSCVSCHGQVDEMPLTWKVASLQMDWCLKCHRDPEPHLRPPEDVFDMNWTPAPGDAEAAAELAAELSPRAMTNCSTCHR